MNKAPMVVAALAHLVLAAGVAQASITSYSSRPAFEAAAGTVVVQDFESFSPTTGAFYGTSFDFGDFSAFNSTNTASFGGDIINAGFVNGSIEITGLSSRAGAFFRLTFDAPITAIGFDANHIADQRVGAFHFDNAAADSVAASDPLDQTRFWGFISDTPFTTITYRHDGPPSSPTDGYPLDNITYTPAPGTFAVLAILLAPRRVRTRWAD